MRAGAGLLAAPALLLCLGGCAPVENALNRIGEPKEQQPLAQTPKAIVKDTAPLPKEFLQQLLQKCPLVLEAECSSIEEIAGTQMVREDRRNRCRTAYCKRRLGFNLLKVVKGVCTSGSFILEDNDFRVDLPDKPGTYFYQEIAGGKWKYALFCEGETLETSAKIVMVRVPLTH